VRIVHLIAALAALGLAAPVQSDSPDDLETAFDEVDLNNDGVIDEYEFRQRMTEVFFFKDVDRDGFLTTDEVDGIDDAAFAAADTDGDGRLSLAEYLEARMADFHSADVDGEGVLTRDEVLGWGQ